MTKETSESIQGPAPAKSETAPQFTHHLSRAERRELGKRLRERCPRSSHAAWDPPPDRANPVDLVFKADQGRMPELLPLRHGRMVRSPFTFYRGSALNMAADLATTPISGIRVQCCGDAHLCNFGGFATPERQVIFSINDLDETLPGPWEWDIKRLAASFVLACRDNGLAKSTAKDVVLSCVRSYREHMDEFSEMKALELWYYALEANALISAIPDAALRRRALKRLAKESSRSIAEDIFPKLTGGSGESVVIKDQLPTIFHLEGHTPGEVVQAVKDAFVSYRQCLPAAHQLLLDRYAIKDAAIKVVGIGSVGTSCWVLLLMAGKGDPLFLQVKEARRSVLEPYAGKSVYSNSGERIVHGYRIMQPYSDMFLGWTRGALGRDFFVRQLRDIKISIRVETFQAAEMNLFAQWCGKALALSHARSGDPAVISGYLGKGDAFDKALANFSFIYADQTERDHAVLERAVVDGKIEAAIEEQK